MKPVLTDSELHLAIPTLKAWKIENDHLVKHFRFAEKLNHHAHWLAVYNKVSLSLQTHEAGGITEKDLEFARMVDDFAE